MMNERSQLLESLLEALIEVPVADRQARLDVVCDDPEIRAELLDLLKHHDADAQDPGFLAPLTDPPSSQPVSDTSEVADGNGHVPSQIGPYRIFDQLGAGGMGTVYRVEHTRLRKQFALKLLSSAAMSNPQLASRFEREMEGVGKLQHANVVSASDAGDIDGHHYLVMDLIEGVTAGELLERHGPLPSSDACELVRQATEGLAHAHAQGIVHRDIKPSNLMVRNDGQVKVVDFGLALLNDSATTSVTQAGAVMGTVDFMSPEQATGSHQVGVRSDIYSLGATLYKLLTGTAPLEDSSQALITQKLATLANKSVLPIRTRRANLPEELARLIDDMLQRDPNKRPSSAVDVAGTLARFTEGSDLALLVTGNSNQSPDSPVIKSTREAEQIQSHRRLGSTMALWLIGVVAIAAVSLLWRSRPADQDNTAGTSATEVTSESWRPVPQKVPATRSVAAWSYLFCVTTERLDQLGPLLENLYELCEEHELIVADNAVTLVYLEGSLTSLDWATAVTKIEIRIRLYDERNSSPSELTAAAARLSLGPVGIRTATSGAEVYVTKPQGITYEGSLDHWEELERYAGEQRLSASYTAPMERYPVEAWDSETDYADLATELIIPLE